MDLAETLQRAGAVLGRDGRSVTGFGDERVELEALLATVALCDRSDLGRVLARGPDILGLLQRLGTGDVAGLATGSGAPSILTTPKGRIVERLIVHNLGPAEVLLVAGPARDAIVVEHLRRFTFAEKTGLEVVTDRDALLSLVGPRGTDVLERLDLAAPPDWGSRPDTIAGVEVHVLGHDGFSAGGFSIVTPCSEASAVWSALHAAVGLLGGRAAGATALETLRVLRGVPAAGHELTEEHNPLEAGQWEAVSFQKGCYVGQEVIARLRTYDKVSRMLVGLELEPGAALPDPGAPLHVAGRRVGSLTSVALPPGSARPLALGYVKKRELRAGLELEVGEARSQRARLVELPFQSPSYLRGSPE